MTPSPSPADQPSTRPHSAWLLLALVFPTLITWLYFVVLAGLQPTSQIAFAVGKAIQFGLPVAWLLYAARERAAWPTWSKQGWGTGVAFGLAVAALMLAGFEYGMSGQAWFRPAEEAIREKLSQLGLESIPRFVALSIGYAAVHSLMEEYYWRWFVYRRLMTTWPAGPAILVSSIGFMSHHIILLAQYFGALSPFTYVASAGVAIGGAFWAWLYRRTGSVGPAWLSHGIVDAAIFFIGYKIAFAT
jgi:membrane protease YdiL (CAAX protease family)